MPTLMERTLGAIVNFVFRYMRPLVENGNIYIAQPPLYQVIHGKNVYYLYSDEELEKQKKNLVKMPG